MCAAGLSEHLHRNSDQAELQKPGESEVRPQTQNIMSCKKIQGIEENCRMVILRGFIAISFHRTADFTFPCHAGLSAAQPVRRMMQVGKFQCGVLR